MLIGLSGWKNSGKNSVGDILKDHYGFTSLYFAEPIYEAVWELNPIICVDYNRKKYEYLRTIVNEMGWDTAKRTYREIRVYLEKLGTEIGRNIIGLDTWVRILDEKLKDLPPHTDIVITDVRFVNEDWYVHSQGGSLWRVVRPGVVLEGSHDSERNQKDLLIDYTVRNNGDLTALYEKVAQTYNEQKKKEELHG